MNNKKEIEYMPIYSNELNVRKKSVQKEEIKRRKKRGLANIKLLLLVAAMGYGGIKAGMHIEESLNNQEKIRIEQEREEKESLALSNAYTKYRDEATKIVHEAMTYIGDRSPNRPYNWDYLIASNELENVIKTENLSDNDITELIFTIRDCIKTECKGQPSFDNTSAMLEAYCGQTIDEYIKAHDLPEDREEADNYLRTIIAIKKGYQFDDLKENNNYGRK